MTRVRRDTTDASSGDQQQGSAYQQWLGRRLEVPVTLPALQLLSAGRYYEVLDQQVGRCIDGKATAEEALAEVSTKWRAINDSVGTEKQERAWRRAQGMRA